MGYTLYHDWKSYMIGHEDSPSPHASIRCDIPRSGDDTKGIMTNQTACEDGFYSGFCTLVC
jgi:hypothetical protein